MKSGEIIIFKKKWCKKILNYVRKVHFLKFLYVSDE